MACLIVPAAEAIVVTVVKKVVEKKEQEAKVTSSKADSTLAENDNKIPFSRKLKWLSNLLWGGSFLLAFEHLWHGEIVPWFPFLTAASDPIDAAEMLHEMATVGVTMALLVTVTWVGMVLVSNAMEKKFVGRESASKVKGGVA